MNTQNINNEVKRKKTMSAIATAATATTVAFAWVNCPCENCDADYESSMAGLQAAFSIDMQFVQTTGDRIAANVALQGNAYYASQSWESCAASAHTSVD